MVQSGLVRNKAWPWLWCFSARENKMKDERIINFHTREHMQTFTRTHISLILVFYKIHEYITRDSSSSSVFASMLEERSNYC